MVTESINQEKQTKLKKMRNRVYSLIGFYRSRGFLNSGQMYALEQAANVVMNYDYSAYSTAKNVISQIKYETK